MYYVIICDLCDLNIIWSKVFMLLIYEYLFIWGNIFFFYLVGIGEIF